MALSARVSLPNTTGQISLRSGFYNDLEGGLFSLFPILQDESVSFRSNMNIRGELKAGLIVSLSTTTPNRFVVGLRQQPPCRHLR